MNEPRPLRFIRRDNNQSLSFAVLEESYRHANRVPSKPIDGSSPVTDHVQRENMQASYKVLITQNPDPSTNARDTYVVPEAGEERIRAYLQFLETNATKVFLVQASQLGRSYEQMVIKSVDYLVNNNLYYEFMINMEEVNVVKSVEVARKKRQFGKKKSLGATVCPSVDTTPHTDASATVNSAANNGQTQIPKSWLDPYLGVSY